MNEHLWQQRGGDDVLYQQILYTFAADSASQCGFKCYTTQRCFGFDFSESSHQCVLHDAAAMTISTPQSVERGPEMWQNFGKYIHFSR